jgi:2-keto-4-pentenoate hydratase/2-oxohepta-3-ene-1,7-dioic acid hydratase in catechol pathway
MRVNLNSVIGDVIVSGTGPGVKVMKVLPALAHGHFQVDVRLRENNLCA